MSNPLEPATREVLAHRFSAGEGRACAETCHLVVEELLALDIAGVGCYTLMCTPCDTVALAVGFAFTEGIITGLRDIGTLYHCEDDPGLIRIQLVDPPQEAVTQRNLVVASSCGMCGTRRTVQELLSGISPVGDSLRLSNESLQSATQAMRAGQRLFAQTGGTHAAGILNASGELLALAEDLGRHNALDKALGRCLLAGQPTAGCWAVLSGRVSLELVSKAARAGLELLAAVSAPTSLAIQAAQAWNLTVCGFVRGDRATVYTHERRVGGSWGSPEEAPNAGKR
jgi:FdhD protein